ncbi:MAG: hypothetical protein LAO79_18155 [Acidobacteriia bacterium]|nr:hypothetical protein [Terriglobia bacterium]
MTCQECELRLSLEQDVSEHLATCAACRALADEMRENAAAIASFADDPLPRVGHRVTAEIRAQSRSRQIQRWGWALAAAAMVLVLLYAWPRGGRPPGPARDPLIAYAPPKIESAEVSVGRPGDRPRTRRSAPHRKPADTLKVKMFTDDPDVVIYWLVEE